MRTRQEPLTSRERRELRGYVGWTPVVARAVLFLLALVVVAAICRGVQRGLQLPDPLWVLPTAAVGLFLYFRAGRWTGGRELRRRIRLDLQAGAALVHHVRVRDAMIFEEREDEGPIVFVHTDAGETLVFTGQDLARDVAHGFPWRELEIRETAHSKHFLGLTRVGEPFRPLTERPPLSPDQFEQLGLSSVDRWQRLEVPFDSLRQVA